MTAVFLGCASFTLASAHEPDDRPIVPRTFVGPAADRPGFEAEMAPLPGADPDASTTPWTACPT
jgi:hypothetical protein